MDTEKREDMQAKRQDDLYWSQPPEKKSSKGRTGLIIVLCILLVLTLIAAPLAGVVGYVFGMRAGSVKVKTGSKAVGINNQAVLSKLESLEGLVDQYFLYETDSEKLEEGIYNGFLRGLDDKYAEYYTAENYKKLLEEDSGKYQGIGVTVMKDTTTNYVVIEGVFRNTPAEEAGLLAGDYIVSVNGRESVDMTLSEVVAEIKREDRKTADLVIYRNGEELKFSVRKTTVEIISVEEKMIDKEIGYIEVTQFIENTDELFNKAVDKLTKKNMKSLIIDLRDNGGGLVDSCVNMLSRFVPEGELITYTEDKNKQRVEYKSRSKETLPIPIILLVNGNSASASEIFVGCMEDYGYAKTVGTKTYGKGIVQSVIPLSDGSAVKFTVSKYFTPKGKNIHETGFEPDTLVEMTDEETVEAREDEKKDKQLQKAIKLLKTKQ